jgi:hypothetical protein
MRDLRLRALCVLTAAAWFLQGCSSLPLEPWHTVQLSEEFRASRADEIRSFEDYLHLEDRLFAQLDAKVYARTPAGPDTALLLHGMSDSPYSLRALGEELNRRHYWVVGLRLPGHGTAPSGLLDVHWEDMAAAVQLAAGPG